MNLSKIKYIMTRKISNNTLLAILFQFVLISVGIFSIFMVSNLTTILISDDMKDFRLYVAFMSIFAFVSVMNLIFLIIMVKEFFWSEMKEIKQDIKDIKDKLDLNIRD